MEWYEVNRYQDVAGKVRVQVEAAGNHQAMLKFDHDPTAEELAAEMERLIVVWTAEETEG